MYPLSVESEDSQASSVANGLGQSSQFLRAQFGGKRFRRWARDGVGVHFFHLSAVTNNLIQAVAVGAQFSGGHRFAADFEKQTLNNDRPDPGGLREVFQDALEPNRRPG